MMLFLVLVFLTVSVLVILARPLFRKPEQITARVDHDMVVYRDQLDEVEKDVVRGLLTSEQATAARTEIHQRMLVAEDTELASMHRGQSGLTRRARLILLTVLIVGLPTGTWFLYACLGSPELPGQPYASRAAPTGAEADIMAMSPDEQTALIQAMVDHLAEKMEKNPNDRDGWLRLAKAYEVLGETDKAKAAKERADQLGK